MAVLSPCAMSSCCCGCWMKTAAKSCHGLYSGRRAIFHHAFARQLVIEETLRVCQRYLATKRERHCLFAVNLSGASLKDPAFRRMLLECLQKNPDLGRICALKSPRRQRSETWPSSMNSSTPCASLAAALRWTIWQRPVVLHLSEKPESGLLKDRRGIRARHREQCH